MTYKQRLEKFLFNNYYMLSVIIIAVMGFGYSITHTTVDIDSLEGNLYFGEGNMTLSAGRFGMNFWAKIFGNGLNDPYHAFTVDLIAVILLAAAAMQFCILFQRVTENRFDMIGCTLFSCLFISYPLINEIWEYIGANLCVCGGYLLAGLAVYCVYEVIHSTSACLKFKIGYIVFSLFCTTIICSAYESIATVYVMVVFTILFMQALYSSKEEMPLTALIRNGCIYAAVLLGGVVLRVVIHHIILIVFQIAEGSNGQTTVLWWHMPINDVVRELFPGIGKAFFLQALWYMPITIVFLCLVVFGVGLMVYTLKHRDVRVLIMGIGVAGSLFLLALIQGGVSPERTCQTYAFFAAFTLLMVYNSVRKRKYLGKAMAVALAILCIQQATFLSNISSINYARSEYEADVIKNIGYDLAKEGYDKSVVFIGECHIPDYIINNIAIKGKRLELFNSMRVKTGREPAIQYKIVRTNVNSVINWSIKAFGGTATERLFEYYGYSIKNETNPDIVAQAQRFVEENSVPAYPQNGYFVEYDDYVIVHLGIVK